MIEKEESKPVEDLSLKPDEEEIKKR